MHYVRSAYEILKLLRIAHPVSISRWSRVFCLCCEVIRRCALRALCVRDSKAFEDSPPGFNFAVEQGILFGSQGDH